MPSPQEILEQLRTVKYPGYTRDIVSFGIVKDIEVGSTRVTVTLAPGGASAEAVAEIRGQVAKIVKSLAGTERVEIVLERSEEQPRRRATGGRQEIPGVRHVVAVASGKGGVGKSTVAVNLALSLHGLGYRVGLLDADVYGPSVPVMLGLHERPRSTDSNRIIPLERFGIKVISMGLFLQQRTPVIWRGPMVTKLLTQFLHDVEWGELDFLILDLPPGTGDAQLTIVQQVPLSGGVIVTTPQEVALLDVQRGITMFNQVHAPVLGIIENMSFHVCSGCGDRVEIFGHGGGAKMAEKAGIPLLGEIPLVAAIRERCDTGEPTVVAEPESPETHSFTEIARRLVQELERAGKIELPAVH
jgi:ATP-binding protein involved in chromosome partitioning